MDQEAGMAPADPSACAGVLIACEPAIKSIIVNINSENNDYIIEDLDDGHLVVQENKVQLLKQKLDEVCREARPGRPRRSVLALTVPSA